MSARSRRAFKLIGIVIAVLTFAVFAALFFAGQVFDYVGLDDPSQSVSSEAVTGE